ncbi:SUF system NifU family Fe-S cluster assembly protein [bacterium]|nr:SUF system NifU family Fe-S cluster assembly protein [bacterium]
MDSLYREVVLDHHRNPRGSRPLDDYDVQASGKNPSCGDEVTLQVRFDGERIAGVGVLSQGCAISTSSGSMMAELIEGRSLDEVETIADRFKAVMHGDDIPTDVDLGDLEALEGVRQFPVRIKCALLPWITLLDALIAHHQGREPDVISTEGLTEDGRPMDVTLEDRR